MEELPEAALQKKAPRESRAQMREVVSAFGADLTPEEFSPFRRKHKNQYGKCRHNYSHSDGNNFPTQVNLYYEEMPGAADSKSGPELETHCTKACVPRNKKQILF